jgi:prolyl 3-hydroxylase /prolyl 3,4-dihydroxylase
MEARPFPHLVIDNFLPDEEAARARETYGAMRFGPKRSDLFEFLQTEELASNPRLAFLKEQLTRLFGGMTDDDGWLTMFASYYSSGDYLLCHDDRIENRLYAFSYYLSDYDSGKLILYEDDCMSVSKRIEVRANRLVVFEVSDRSYHEVGYCEKDGRMAFTGWFNTKGINHDNGEPEGEEAGSEALDVVDGFPLEIDFTGDKLLFYPGIEYDFDHRSKAEEGPFHSRRVERLVLESPLLPRADGWETVGASFYHFRVGDYILLNDRSNHVEGSLCDVFIMGTEDPGAEDDEFVEGEEVTFGGTESSIRYVDGEGRVMAELPVRDRSMFVVKREGLRYFVGRSSTGFFLAHFVLRQTA